MDSMTVPSLSPSTGCQLSVDEMKLLAKLEEQNRLLETDSKSLYPMNGVLQSPTSPKPFSFEDDIWGNVIKEWDDWRKRKVGQIKVLIRRGIPAHLRPTLWQLLCDAQNVAVQQKYSDLLNCSSPSETLILRDLTRILPQHQLFHNKVATCQKPLFNVLKAYSILDREIGYCQGSVFIVGLLLTQMAEEEAFYIFVRLMKDFRMRDLYRSNMVELGCCIHQFEAMIKDELPELHSHFQTQGFHTSMFSSSWFLNILLSSLPFTAAIRIFDIFMCEGLEIVFRVGLALLHMKQAELIKLDVEGMMNCLENLESWASDPDGIIEAAYQIKYNPSRMKQLRQEYASIKTKKLEEQEELNGLSSENKHLKQRLALLEKRCSEKLVSQLKKELEKTRLNTVRSQSALKEMQANILQMEESRAASNEDSVMYLQTELISHRLQEAEALTELRVLKQHIKDLEEKWQRQQVNCGGQQRVSSAQNELQVELLSTRLKETLTQAALKESRHRLMKLQTENNIYSNQLKQIEAHINSQQDHLQELTSQNQDLCSQLQQSRRQFSTVQYKRKEKQDKEGANLSIIAVLQKQITELQIQIQSLSKHTTSFSQPTPKPSTSTSLKHNDT
ncbi:ecotropic viral integration site 5 protein homolog isoform X1 [Carassius auratus]|uniref:Ecotropic viral integration site 5 protein homolog isoform X1 n=1 Tax=Carassius auratus TaxID=7957 RepID=A0A6P6JRS7_CARAU|nr:ecotropic viral integration site 5 protein homolog isoform X1 [Carassius auratus]XP_026061946.1 ecotropic viral integration site 5 protein homolog isoform X1 [Carassius auratus]XP_026061947.1 ecotropic viral integration site 5 protein homolog isoform X1 [Carassius auratus]XP_026061948.1 ecotropic viral integration site 5 protein homolog isoform X1 [Carassius auratus]